MTSIDINTLPTNNTLPTISREHLEAGRVPAKSYCQPVEAGEQIRIQIRKGCFTDADEFVGLTITKVVDKGRRKWDVYFTIIVGDVATEEVAASAAPLATEKQVAYLVRLGATNDEALADMGRYAMTMAQLRAMTVREASAAIDALKSR